MSKRRWYYDALQWRFALYFAAGSFAADLSCNGPAVALTRFVLLWPVLGVIFSLVGTRTPRSGQRPKEEGTHLQEGPNG